MADWSETAKVVLEQRYLKKDRKGIVIETPDDMLVRVATTISKAEKPRQQGFWQDKFFTVMDDLEFLPNSPTLMNAGRELGQLAACFVIEIEDDLAAILEAVKRASLIHKSGGGTGLVFSKIRPSNSMVGTTNGVASGPVSFMKIFNTATEVIKQGGVRRGANLGTLIVSHPDILGFIICKNEVGAFENFNISVAITDQFITFLKMGVSFRLFSGIKFIQE